MGSDEPLTDMVAMPARRRLSQWGASAKPAQLGPVFIVFNIFVLDFIGRAVGVGSSANLRTY